MCSLDHIDVIGSISDGTGEGVWVVFHHKLDKVGFFNWGGTVDDDTLAKLEDLSQLEGHVWVLVDLRQGES